MRERGRVRGGWEKEEPLERNSKAKLMKTNKNGGRVM